MFALYAKLWQEWLTCRTTVDIVGKPPAQTIGFSHVHTIPVSKISWNSEIRTPAVRSPPSIVVTAASANLQYFSKGVHLRQINLGK